MRSRTVVVLSVVIVVVLAAASTVAIAVVAHGHDRDYRRGFASPSCSVPDLPGTIVNVRLMNSGGPMMGGPMMGGARGGGMMRLTATPTDVAAGRVSFVATNVGSINHELVILPLPADAIVGTRAVGSDGSVDESGSLGEASNTCGAGSGDGIAPGSSSWVTLTLPAGRYELVCNLPGHYAAGMYTQLTVRTQP